MICPSRLKAKRMVYSIPWRASSFGGGLQHARNAAYISRIESKGFSCTVSSVSLVLLLAPASDVLGESSSSVETMVSRRSWPIGGRNCGKHGPKSKTLQYDESGSLLGRRDETGVSLTLGTVYGVDGLKTGGGGGGGAGGGGATNCWFDKPPCAIDYRKRDADFSSLFSNGHRSRHVAALRPARSTSSHTT